MHGVVLDLTDDEITKVSAYDPFRRPDRLFYYEQHHNNRIGWGNLSVPLLYTTCRILDSYCDSPDDTIHDEREYRKTRCHHQLLILGKLPGQIFPEPNLDNTHSANALFFDKIENFPPCVRAASNDPYPPITSVGVPGNNTFWRLSFCSAWQWYIQVLHLLSLAVWVGGSDVGWLTLPIWRIGTQVVPNGCHRPGIGKGTRHAWKLGYRCEHRGSRCGRTMRYVRRRSIVTCSSQWGG